MPEPLETYQKRLEYKRKIQRQIETLPKANKPRPRDNSGVFKLIGGKQHDMMVRMFAPFERDELVFPDGETYAYDTNPVGRSKAHVFLYRGNYPDRIPYA